MLILLNARKRKNMENRLTCFDFYLKTFWFIFIIIYFLELK